MYLTGVRLQLGVDLSSASHTAMEALDRWGVLPVAFDAVFPVKLNKK